ncbi:ExbD/TolR family protein [Pseudooceanicola sp. C21-150M6]|uniref:ExbD/TolR family protein n=1 Tax=Pseudooceanicola sp. C21-150M6 TaxID=3434355 RepID=UPI003D7FD8AB
MMDFAAPRKKNRAESTVPMINVVFLLLIFFLMTAELAPPDPVEVTPPTGAGQTADGAPPVLYLAADGTLAYGELRGENAVAAFAGLGAEGAQLRADSGVEASKVARALKELGQQGLTSVSLVMVPE